MDWLRLTLCCEQAALDDLSACLTQAGAEEQEILDDWESIRAQLESARKQWDYVDPDEVMAQKDAVGVRVYVADDEAGRQKRAAIENAVRALGETRGHRVTIEIACIREEDWANTWRQFYHPMPIGERLIIVPDWEDAQGSDRVALRMEPGLVFGSGEHQSTQLCLAALDRETRANADVLDLGCGSGILSIAALLLGAKQALAVDIDPNAMGTARENARRNSIADERYAIRIGDATTSKALQAEIGEKRYGIVLANIVADVIIALAPYVARWLREDGKFICSGIISERRDDVETALALHGLRVTKRAQKDDWVCLEASLG